MGYNTVMEKVVITGASGFLGTKLHNGLQENYSIVGTYNNNSQPGLRRLDITNPEEVMLLMNMEKPNIVIHTVALADPDICETNREKAKQIDVDGVKNIVEACRSIGATLIYISTVYIFDGEKGNYQESDVANPVNYYGETKQEAEQLVKTLPEYIILRFDLLYGYNGDNLPNGFMGKIMKGNKLPVNAEQKRQPLLIDDVVWAIDLLLKQHQTGVFHLAGPDNLTKYELGQRLEAILDRDTSCLVPIAGEKQTARRPSDASVNTAKIQQLGMKFHTVEEAVQLIQEQMNN